MRIVMAIFIGLKADDHPLFDWLSNNKVKKKQKTNFVYSDALNPKRR